MEKLSLQILSQINTWKFKRAHPRKINELENIFAHSLEKNNPIPIFGYWGIGNKEKPNESEKNTLAHLNDLRERVKKIYAPGLRLIFIISDVHALNNQIPKERIESYIKEIEKMLRGNNCETILLSHLYIKHNLPIEEILNTAKGEEKIWWLFFPERRALIEQAKKVSLARNKKFCARQYALMRKKEAEILKEEYKNCIFITYSSPQFNMLYPDLPTLYLSSEREGCCHAPWFK